MVIDEIDPSQLNTRRGVTPLLFHDNREDVRLERWAPGATVVLDASGGIEVLVLAGSFCDRGETFVLQSWLRLPGTAPLRSGSRVHASGANAATLPKWRDRRHDVHSRTAKPKAQAPDPIQKGSRRGAPTASAAFQKTDYLLRAVN